MGFIKDMFRTKIENDCLVFVDATSKALGRITLPISSIVSFKRGIGGQFVTDKGGKEYKLPPISKQDIEYLKSKMNKN